MPKPWDIAGEEARIWGTRIRERRAAADRLARPIFGQQLGLASTERRAPAGDSNEGPSSTHLQPDSRGGT